MTSNECFVVEGVTKKHFRNVALAGNKQKIGKQKWLDMTKSISHDCFMDGVSMLEKLGTLQTFPQKNGVIRGL